jgi:hypothetical protein
MRHSRRSRKTNKALEIGAIKDFGNDATANFRRLN